MLCGLFVCSASKRNIDDFLRGEHKQNTFQREKKILLFFFFVWLVLYPFAFIVPAKCNVFLWGEEAFL